MQSGDDVDLAVIFDEHPWLEIVLGPESTAVARLSTDADARIEVPTETISNVLLGLPFDADCFRLVSGEAAARPALLRAIRAPFE